jgi:hypothetical protein
VTDEQQTYRYLTMRYEQDLDRETRRVRRSRETRREADMRTPFRSRPVDELAAEGYVDRSGPSDIYFAPDANVLLSDAFLDTHCFRVAFGGESGETAGLMGLTFEPVSTRGAQVDVAGTLWLDLASSELRFLQYRYVNLAPDVRDDALGGRVAFERMPEGGWIVREWWIRMPRMSRQWDLRGEETITYLSGYREAGGLVLDVQGAGLALGHSLTGAMEGLVQDSTGRPVRGSRVRLVGTEHVAFTDSTGFFRFADLVQGVYDLEVSEAGLERVGYPPTTRTRAVVNGESTLVDVSLPSVRAHLVATCIGAEVLSEWLELARDYPGAGILYGWVVDDPTGLPVPGALVRVLTPTVAFTPGRERSDGGHREGVRLGGVETAETGVIVHQGAVGVGVATDERGFFRVCNLPERHPIVVSVVVDGVESDEVRLRVDEPGGVVEHVIRVGARRQVPR